MRFFLFERQAQKNVDVLMDLADFFDGLQIEIRASFTSKRRQRICRAAPRKKRGVVLKFAARATGGQKYEKTK